MFRYCVTKNFPQKIRISGFMHKIFRYQKVSETQKVSTTKFLSTVRWKNSTENRDIPFSCVNFFDAWKFLKQEGFPYEISQYREEKNLDRKSFHPLLLHKKFRYQKFLDTEKVSSTKCFGIVRQKTSTENLDILFLCQYFFDTRNFHKHRGFPLRNFSVLWDKNLRQKIRISRSMHKVFQYQKFSETQKGSFTKCFGSVKQKTSTENRDMPFLCTKCFDTRNLLKHRRFLSTIVSVVWDKKPPQKIVISPSYAQNVSKPEIYWNTEGFLQELFR